MTILPFELKFKSNLLISKNQNTILSQIKIPLINTRQNSFILNPIKFTFINPTPIANQPYHITNLFSLIIKSMKEQSHLVATLHRTSHPLNQKTGLINEI